MKNNKGITLVALVITIIVLLILAGVSISMVVGENGVLNRATDAAMQTSEADARSALETALSGAQGDFIGKWNLNNTLTFANCLAASDATAVELKPDGYFITWTTKGTVGKIQKGTSASDASGTAYDFKLKAGTDSYSVKLVEFNGKVLGS